MKWEGSPSGGSQAGSPVGAETPAARHMQQSAASVDLEQGCGQALHGPHASSRSCVCSLVVEPQRVGLQSEVLHVGRLLLGKQDHDSQVGEVELLVQQAPPGQMHAQVLKVHMHLRAEGTRLLQVSQPIVSPAEAASVAGNLGWVLAQVHQVQVHLQGETAAVTSLTGVARPGAEERQAHTELHAEPPSAAGAIQSPAKAASSC